LHGSAVPVAEFCRHVEVGHEVADLPARALMVGGQEHQHVVAVVAAQGPLMRAGIRSAAMT